MRLPDRSVSIFTLSALDVLAMAAGVFVLLLVMLMPYYRKTFDAGAHIEAVRAATAETRTRIPEIGLELARVTASGEAAVAEAERLEAAAAALETETIAMLERAGALAAAAARRPQPKPQVEGGGRTDVVDELDLVFVVDTTASMRPVIRDLAFSMRGIVRVLERLVPSVQVGVVAYKDRDTGLPPVTSLPLAETDRHLPRIVRFVEDLEATTVGSRTEEEDLHLGLDAAMRMRFRHGARQAVIVIGDAAAHRRAQMQTLFRAEGFAQREEHRTISTLFVTTPNSLRHGQRGRPFFQKLADAGGGTFSDHTGSMIESVLLSVLID